MPTPVADPPDRELAAALALFRQSAPVTTATSRLQAMRETSGRFSAPLSQLRRGGRIVTEQLHASERNGPPVDLLSFRPRGREEARACIYHVHGGGMVTGDSRTSIEPILDWIEPLQIMVVSVTYRLAPEHPFPAQVDDCYAGLEWTAGNARRLGYAAGHIVLAGGSAGGGLAASTMLMARDRQSPPVLGALLMSPMLDDRTRPAPTDAADNPFAKAAAGPATAAAGRVATTDGVWDLASNEFGWGAVLGDLRGAPDVSYYAAAARAGRLDSLPPVYLDVGSAEILRKEAGEFAGRIRAARGAAELHVWPGAYHGFDVIAPESGVSKAAAATRLRWLERLLRAADAG